MESSDSLNGWDHCRDQAEQLCAVWRTPEIVPASVLVYGNSRAIDKSVLVKGVLQHLNRTFVHVNPEEVASEPELWSTIWGRLQCETIEESEQERVAQDLQHLRRSNTVFLKTQCRTFLEFIRYTEFRFRHSSDKPVVLLEDAEKVENLSRGLLRRLCRHEGSGFSLALISTSASAFQFATSRSEAMLPCVHIPTHSLETTVELVHREVQALSADTEDDFGMDGNLMSFISHVSLQVMSAL